MILATAAFPLLAYYYKLQSIRSRQICKKINKWCCLLSSCTLAICFYLIFLHSINILQAVCFSLILFFFSFGSVTIYWLNIEIHYFEILSQHNRSYDDNPIWQHIASLLYIMPGLFIPSRLQMAVYVALSFIWQS